MSSDPCRDEAKNLYRSRMDDFVNLAPEIPTSWELRQRHQEFAFECLDMFRKESKDGSANAWKLESDLKNLYSEYVLANKQSRQLALMRYALSDQSATAATEAF